MWLWILLLLVGLIAFVFFYYSFYLPRFYPPGPRPWPLAGNAIAVYSAERPETVLAEWKKQYGDVFTFWAGYIPIVTVNSLPLMQEMFVKDDRFDDKQTLDSFTKLVRGDTNLGIMGAFSSVSFEQRRFALHALRNFGMSRPLMQERILEEVGTLCSELNAASAAGVEEHDVKRPIERAVGSAINSLICGYRFVDHKEAEFYKMKDCLNNLNSAFTSFFASLPITLPFLRKLPVFRPRFERAVGFFHDILDFLERNIEEHKQQNDYATMDEPQDFMSAYLLEQRKREESGEPHFFSQPQLRNVCFDIWIAGQETTSITINWAVAFLVVHSDLQQRVHEELDRVVGGDRMVVQADKQHLPLLNACMMETQRKANIVSLNSLRVTKKPVEVGGVVLPVGTTVTPQIAALMADPELHSAFNQTFGLVRRLKALYRFEKEGDLEAKRQEFIENFSSFYQNQLRAMNDSGDAVRAADARWRLAKIAALLRAGGISWPFDVTPVRPPNSTRVIPLVGQRLRVEWLQGGNEEWRARYEDATHFRAFVRKSNPGLGSLPLNKLPPVIDWPAFFEGTAFNLDPDSRVYFKSLHFFEELQQLREKGVDLVESTIQLALAEQLNEFSFLFDEGHAKEDFAAFIRRLLPLFSSVLIESQLPEDVIETTDEVTGILGELTAKLTAGLSNLFPPGYELLKILHAVENELDAAEKLAVAADGPRVYRLLEDVLGGE
ncbi:(pine wood nematode) hypothetical protein [Aphelenchoides fujianensis]|nr:(pine wood nematode) hypothetical protein [Aphelenchoides fujianensis]